MANTQHTIDFDFSKFAFTAEQIRDINQLVYEGIERLPEISAIHQMWGGIVYDKEVGFITGGGLVGKKGQGCNPQLQDWNIGTRKVLWQPKEWEIYLGECAEDLKNTMAVYCLRLGTQVDDLTATDYMNIVVEVLIGAIYKFMYRLIWLNDTDAENVDIESLPKVAKATLTAVPTAAVASLTALPTAAESAQTGGSAIVGTVYEGVESTAAGAVKCSLADGTIVYLDAEVATGTASSEKTYYTKDTDHKTTPIEGTVYEGVNSATAGAVKCALADGTVVYLDADAATGVADAEKTYYTKDAEHELTPIEGTIYMKVAPGTLGAVKGATEGGAVIYTAEDAASGLAQSGKEYYSRDEDHPVTIQTGEYTEDIDIDYFNIIDGLFKQLRGYVAEDDKRGITIDANSQSSKDAQLAYMTPERAYNLLLSMWYKAPMKLRNMKADKNVENRPKFLVTQTIADAYEQYLIGKGIDRTYINLTEGVEVLSLLGIAVVPMPVWDEMIQAYQDLGDTYFKPHRALLTTKSVLAVGTPTEGKLFGDFDIWYNKDERKTKILLKDKLDAKIANPDHFIYAE